jgi:site-specific DNA-methyltransferase (adenine-specific)
MERNTVVRADALDWLRSLPDGSVDVFWSSPPYNLADRLRGGNSVTTKVRHAYAAGTGRGDGSLIPEPAYQDEQVAVLTEWHRCLTDDGVAFYNHKVRIKGGRAISPLEWIRRTPFVLLQELVWDRGGTANVDDRRFLPVSERIYVLTRRPGLRLANRNRWPDVLRFHAHHHKRAESGHPCPTPWEVVGYCLSAVARPPDGRRLLVADSYMGSGTTGLAARMYDMDYTGCDRSAEYVALSERNLGQRPAAQLELEAAG